MLDHQNELSEHSCKVPEAVAIVGMACRLPGGATNVEKLWTALASGKSGWSPHPERQAPGAYYHPKPGKAGCYNSKGAHYLDEDIGLFDAQFFGLTSAEANALDPQQRLLLEVAYEALENAGIPLSDVAGTDVGVFIGGCMSEYRALATKLLCPPSMFAATGTAEALLSNRISYAFDLRGPSMSIDTACSSSLVALNSAFQSLQTRESSAAIVGSCNLRIEPDSTVALSATRLLAPDGRSYSFDERGDSGFGRGEGTSCIVLKLLSAAVEAEDPIRAVIRNTGVNQDGKTVGITMPNGAAQSSLMRSVYMSAALNPADTDYIEAHGTGTAIGDPIEAAALAEVFCPRPSQRPLTIGSIKSNIGHLEAASGVSSVVKTALMLERKFLLPNYDLQAPKKNIPFSDWNMKVADKYRPWDSQGVRRASVNNFGFGGTNAHVVMEEAAPQMVAQNVSFADVWKNEVIGGQPHYGVGKHVYTFSAHNQESLRQQASLIAQYVRERPLTLHPGLLASLAYTLGQRRSTFQWKFAVAAVTQEELIENLKTAALVPSKSSEQPRIGFLFTGQGSQWATMGKKLFDAYPIYAQTIRRAADILAGLGAEWSLIEELVKPRELSLIDKPHVSQPACTALQIALVDLLWSWSITPKSVCGHSSGEIAAAYAANILDFESCMKVAYYRGTAANLMAEMTDENPGRMLVLAIGQQDAQALIDTNVGGRVGVACVNSPRSTTVSGDASGIAALQDTATERSIWNRLLKVDVAYHSHHMEIVADKYSSLVGLVEPKVQTTTEFHSSLRGNQIDPSSVTASYWVDNLTSPVLFSQAVESLCNARGSDGSRAVDILLEVGPHSALQGPIRQTLQSFEGSHRNIQVLPTLIRNEDEVLSMLRLSARIFTAGYRLDLRKVNFPDADSTAPKILTDLPRYQWNHNKKYWYDTRIKQEKIKFSPPRNDLLGSLIPECGLLEPQWKNELLVDDIPWLRDHKVQNVTVFPMAGYICMALEACKQQAKWRNIPYDRIIFREVSVLLSLAIPESTSIELRLSLTPFDEGPRSPSDLWSKFKVSSWSSDRGWQEHCRGLVASQLPQEANAIKQGGDLDSGLQKEIANLSRQAARCNDDVNIDWLYGMCAYSGFEFGPIFQNITQAKSSIALGVYEGTAPHTVGCMPYNCESDYTIHPVTLDLVFQGPSLFLTKDDQAARGPYVPIGIGELGILTDVPRPAGASLRIYTRMKEQDRISWRSVFDCLAVDLQKDPSSCGIWVKNFVEIPLQQDSQNAQFGGKGRCLRTQWEPCVSYLDQSQCRQMLNLNPPPPSIIEQLHILDQLGLHYMEQALKKTEVESAKSPISKKLLGWMQKLVRETPKQNSMVAEGLDMILRTVNGGLVDNVGILSPAAALMCRVGENLPAIVQGEVDATSLVTQDGILDHYYQEWDSPKRLHLLVAKYIAKSAHQNPHIRILQIGADTATLAFTVLNALESAVGAAARFARYEITSSGLELSDVVKAKLRPWERQVSFRKLNIQQAPATQGLDPESYDLALISSPSHVVLHSTKAVIHIRSLLRLGGRAIFIGDLHGEERPRSLPFAVLSSWWGEEMVYDQIHQTDVVDLKNPDDQWDAVLKTNGFSGLDMILRDFPDHPLQAASVFSTTAIPPASLHSSLDLEIVIIEQWLPHGAFRAEIEVVLQERHTARFEWRSFPQLVDTSLVGKYCIILDDPEKPLMTQLTAENFPALKQLPLAAGVLWITSGPLCPNSGLVRGLARTIRSEFQMEKFVTLAVDNWETSNIDFLGLIAAVFEHTLVSPSPGAERDTEFAVVEGVIQIPRLVNDDSMDNCLTRETQADFRELQPFVQDGRPLKMKVANPGFLDTLCFVEDDLVKVDLGPYGIEFNIKAAGVNFKDVILALGQLPGNHLGQEGSGVVTRVGSQVSTIKPGDRICAISGSTIANVGRCPAECAVVLPDLLSFEEGASIPIVYCTAHYCLAHVAKLQPEETILIHAAAGGVGQAAIMLAQAAKARILVTVGSEEKKTYLMQTYHIPEQSIFYSRDTSFMQDVLDATDGRGVDVALNSLAGDQLRATWQCMAPFGRFVEIGKRDIMNNMNLEMSHFEHSVSFAAVDLGDLVNYRRPLLQKVFLEVMDLFRSWRIRPVSPIHEYPVSEVESAFRTLQSGKLLGKLVIVPRPDDMVMASRPSCEPAIFKAEDSYLITGGTGGIGRATCSWMADRGAKNIILASRSGKAQENTISLIEELSEKGVRVEVCQVDVASELDLSRMVSECAEIMPPVKGVIHAAWVNKDVLFEQVEFQDWTDVIQPKVQGAWSLHNAFSNHELDFFIMLSSISGIVGSRGQAAYAAANSFLDGFAHFRVSQGLPATVIDLGVVTEIGYVADRPELQATLQSIGVGLDATLNRADVLALVKLAVSGQMDKSADHQCVVGLTFEGYSPQSPAFFWATEARFSHLRHSATAPGDANAAGGAGTHATIRQTLKSARSHDDASKAVLEALEAKISEVTGVPRDEINSEKSIVALGIDSLIAVEIRGWIVRETDATISTMEMMTSSSTKDVAGLVVKKSKLCKEVCREGNADK